MAIHKVTLLGADGHLGPFILDALVTANFDVTVLKRKSSKSSSNYPSSVKVVKLSDELPENELKDAFTGQDAVIITTPGSLLGLHKRIARAAASAGVQRLIPADFGSVDSNSKTACDLVLLYEDKRQFRLHLTDLAKEHEAFSWTSLVCGHFFYAETFKFLHIFREQRTIDVLGEGTIAASASTMEQIARATVRILQYVDKADTKNQMLFIQSFCKTPLEVKEAAERVTGEKWEVNKLDEREFVEKEKARREKGGEGAAEAEEELVWYLGSVDADWRTRDTFAMQMLGLEEEDIDEVLRECLGL